jgi:hypothetical protein
MHNDVKVALYNNLVKPIQNGYEPPDELRGKYKPSWEMPFRNSPMKDAFMQEAENHNLHHYHFGYKIYTLGNDPIYDGEVSDGIAHTKILNDDKIRTHQVIEICLTHPSPFKVPFDRVHDE